MTLSVAVTGMSCGCSASTIRSQVLPLRGVERVEVDVLGGRVTVSGGPLLEESQVRAAIVEAGYKVAS
ncbi:heavy metal-associated domain-containing protein [Nonomuraea angiospora]|uniref:heavy-metal-associated domain-containing protein n=1 Tax=Nonomuraea angiospora TaxID=46172 RepID=UPI00344C352A